MPAITAASAKLAYDKAANSLKRACNSLERYLPPSQDAAEDTQLAPPLAPRRRVDSVAGCALCVSELMDLEPGDRTNHQCTHLNPPPQQDLQQEVDTGSTAGSDTGIPPAKSARVKQPNLGVIKDHIARLDSTMDRFSDAVTVLCSTFTDEPDKILYQDHLIVWNEHCDDLKDRAYEVIALLEAAQPSVAVQQSTLPPAFSGPGPRFQTQPMSTQTEAMNTHLHILWLLSQELSNLQLRVHLFLPLNQLT